MLIIYVLQEFEIANIDIKSLAQPNIYLQMWEHGFLNKADELGQAVLPILK